MLERLEIHHYALIEDVTINLCEGFTVITGETGAGKSIILGALSLLLGEKTDVQSIRSGCESATVSASFFLGAAVSPSLSTLLAERDLDLDEGTLVLSRTIKSNGRSTISIQGRVMTRSDLASISEELIDISAQRDHQSLLSPSHQRDVLDAFGSCLLDKIEYQKQFAICGDLQNEIEKLSLAIQNSSRESEFLKFAVDEITKADPKPGEDERISEQVKTIGAFEQIHDALALAGELLHGTENGPSVLGSLHQAAAQLALAARGDVSIDPFRIRMETASIECEDIFESIRDYLAGMSYSEQQLDELQARQALLQRLKKKYGHSIENMLAFKEECQSKLMQSENGEELLNDLEKKLAREKQLLLQKASLLSQNRKKGALRLQKEIEQTLRSLGMPQATFLIEVRPVSPNPSGSDDISFMICANPGLDSRSIREVASGGELSRVMLALKTVLSLHDSVGTLIFDEVDAGIGGSVAVSVAKQLKKLSESHQVIAITHLASIASQADTQLVVSKRVESGMSFTNIVSVENEERVGEIARMLSGDAESQVSLVHAKELLGGH
ncbi:DNA repair protein RecN [Sphaerochaeta pleomorpha str. Grapes]|uniref:DNA repair protein RecN n=1 Tax=Sphaerochaeta pleomorpha (strain ATCC BAA-1885 / DSM 22778 / Grapes) TaxID=158190 RepID=G8QXF1_SPHPG|nr:DNA repair protein RecN [Sphaerochaeta pleomorpha]AEV28452.1 DNA repair protein RecN [Sphaerochaeta pleomorpha str. Grapes]